MTLIVLSAAWLIGIAAAHRLSPPLAVVGLLAILPLAALLLWRDDPKVRRIAACDLFLLLGSVRYTLSPPDLSDPSHIAAYTDQGKVILRDEVVCEPDVRDTYTNLRLTVDRVRIEDGEHLVKGKVLVRARATQPICTAMSWRSRASLRRRQSSTISLTATTWRAKEYTEW